MPSYLTLTLLFACVASAAVIPHTPSALDPASSVLKILQSSGGTNGVPDLSAQLVTPTSTDVRGSTPHLINLATDIVRPSSDFSITALTPDMTSTDKFLFGITMPAFLAAKAAKKPTSLDWTDDGCSHSPDFPGGFNFLNSCMRHDFGYGNYKTQGRFTEVNRERIDNNFLADLKRECDRLSFFPGLACKATAEVYHTAVRSFGNL